MWGRHPPPTRRYPLQDESGDPRSNVAVRSTGHERLPYLSRMCSSMASVVAHLTRVRPGRKERATRTGKGRGASEPSRRTTPAMCSAPPGRVGPVADVDQLAMPVLICRCTKVAVPSALDPGDGAGGGSHGQP